MHYDTLILGIDAAWTASQPSGVALVGRAGGVWVCLDLCPSYGEFIREGGQADVDWFARPAGVSPKAVSLVNAVVERVGRAPDIVVADLPLANSAITGRRAADNAISRLWGRAKCSTHSPGVLRPGPISAEFRDGFRNEGYDLLTTEPIAGVGRVLMETYPHPTAMALLRTPERACYKAAKIRTYWPHLAPDERKRALVDVWTEMTLLLSRRISGLELLSAQVQSWHGHSNAGLKRWEDALDALLCVLAGIAYADGEAECFGNEDAAIWLPASAQAHLQSLAT